MNEKAAQAVYNFFIHDMIREMNKRMSPDEGKADPAMKNKNERNGKYMGRGIKLSEIAERMDLKNLTPELDLTEKRSPCAGRQQTGASVSGLFLIILTQTAYRSSGM